MAMEVVDLRPSSMFENHGALKIVEAFSIGGFGKAGKIGENFVEVPVKLAGEESIEDGKTVEIDLSCTTSADETQVRFPVTNRSIVESENQTETNKQQELEQESLILIETLKRLELNEEKKEEKEKEEEKEEEETFSRRQNPMRCGLADPDVGPAIDIFPRLLTTAGQTLGKNSVIPNSDDDNDEVTMKSRGPVGGFAVAYSTLQNPNDISGFHDLDVFQCGKRQMVDLAGFSNNPRCIVVRPMEREPAWGGGGFVPEQPTKFRRPEPTEHDENGLDFFGVDDLEDTSLIFNLPALTPGEIDTILGNSDSESLFFPGDTVDPISKVSPSYGGVMEQPASPVFLPSNGILPPHLRTSCFEIGLSSLGYRCVEHSPGHRASPTDTTGGCFVPPGHFQPHLPSQRSFPSPQPTENSDMERVQPRPGGLISCSVPEYQKTSYQTPDGYTTVVTNGCSTAKRNGMTLKTGGGGGGSTIPGGIAGGSPGELRTIFSGNDTGVCPSFGTDIFSELDTKNCGHIGLVSEDLHLSEVPSSCGLDWPWIHPQADVIRFGHVNQLNHANQVNHMNGVSQANHVNLIGQVSPVSQANHVNLIGQVSPVSQAIHVNQLSHVNQVNHVNQMNQVNQVNQVNQKHHHLKSMNSGTLTLSSCNIPKVLHQNPSAVNHVQHPPHLKDSFLDSTTIQTTMGLRMPGLTTSPLPAENHFDGRRDDPTVVAAKRLEQLPTAQNLNNRNVNGCQTAQESAHLLAERKQLVKASSIIARLTKEQITAPDSDHDTLLHVAIAKGERHLTEALINRIDRDKLTQTMLNMKNGQGHTPLCLATVTNQSTSVRLLVERGADVNIRVPLGVQTLNSFCNPVHFAASNGQEWLQTLHELLRAKNIDLTALDSEGCTALHKSVMAHGLSTVSGRNFEKIDSKESIQQLILNGIDISQQDFVHHKTAFHMALERGHLDLFSFMIDLSSQRTSLSNVLNTGTRETGDTILHILAAIVTSDLTQILTLIRRVIGLGANPRLRNRDNLLPHELASRPQVAELLKVKKNKSF